MIRKFSPRGVQTTTLRDPNMFVPNVTNRCSPWADSSSTVKARGSFKTPSPSVSEIPCFLRFAASFLGSNIMVTQTIYAFSAYITRRKCRISTHGLTAPVMNSSPQRRKVRRGFQSPRAELRAFSKSEIRNSKSEIPAGFRFTPNASPLWPLALCNPQSEIESPLAFYSATSAPQR